MSLEISALASNLYHMSQSGENSPLTPSLWGSQVYSNCWRAAFDRKVSVFLWEKSSIDTSLKNTIQITDKAFQQCLSNMETAISTYQKYLESSVQQKDYNEDDELEQARFTINQWSQWMQPVIRAAKDQFKAKLTQFIAEKILEKAIHIEKISKQIQRIIDFEITIRNSLPINALKKLLDDKNPEKQAHWNLNDWVRLCRERGSVRQHHKALLSVFQPDEVIEIEWKLAKLFDHNLWKPFDQKHLQWRSSVKKLGGYELGTPLGIPPEFDDNHWTFPIKNLPGKVAVICGNRALTSLEQKEYEKNSPKFLKRASLDHIATNGSYKVMERFGEPLATYSWQNPDQPLIDNLANLIDSMIRENIFLDHLCPNNLLYNSDTKELKTYKVLLPTRFSMSQLENFLYDSVQGDLTRFNKIIAESQAANHLHRRYFLAVIEDALEINPKGHSALAEQWKITGDSTISHAASLAENAKMLFAQCQKKFQWSKQTMPANLGEQFLAKCKNGPSSFIPNNIVGQLTSNLQ